MPSMVKEGSPRAALIPGAIVMAADSLASVQSPMGDLVEAERLGPGVVRAISDEGTALVYWFDAAFEVGMEPREVRVLSPNGKVVTVVQTRPDDGRRITRHLISTRAGLAHHWTVELWPRDVVRTIREDGLVWTFDWYPLFERVHPHHTILLDTESLPEDDDAEALTAAELALA